MYIPTLTRSVNLSHDEYKAKVISKKINFYFYVFIQVTGVYMVMYTRFRGIGTLVYTAYEDIAHKYKESNKIPCKKNSIIYCVEY